MKTTFSIIGVLLSTMVIVAAPAQSGWRGLLPSVSGNLAMTKEQAERGDANSQLELANDLAGNHLIVQAVEWYRKAAAQGNIQAKYRLGEILLHGASAPDPQQRVPPNPLEGVRWTLEAATNFYPEACHNMAYVLENGVCLSTNIVEAYAWLEVYSRSNSQAARLDMDRLALRMTLQEPQESHTVASQYMSRQWGQVELPKTPEADLGLKLNGITVGPVSLAIINGRTFEQGETGAIPAKEGTAIINCTKIEPDSVQIAVQGESQPRILRLK